MSSDDDAQPWLPPWLQQNEKPAAPQNRPEIEKKSAPEDPEPAVSPPPWQAAEPPRPPLTLPEQPHPLPPQPNRQSQIPEAWGPISLPTPDEPAPQASAEHPPAPWAITQAVTVPPVAPGVTPPVAPAPPVAPPTLDDVPLLRRAARPPQTGWRRILFQLSGGRVNLGQSPEEKYVAQLVSQVRRPSRGDYRIAVLSLKGGVGKTTTTVSLGSTFASMRGDRVIAVDANPDFGTLGNRAPQQTRSTVRDLLNAKSVKRYSDVRAHTSQNESRLEILSSERDPSTSIAFSADEYRAAVKILQKFYSIILTDCGTGLMHSAMSGVLEMAQTLVLISSPAIDGARSAAATLDWLSQHGYQKLVESAVVVINSERPDTPTIGMEQLQQYFLSRCRAVHVVPFDEHLAQGSEIDMALMSRDTRRAYLELAASVAQDFGK